MKFAVLIVLVGLFGSPILTTGSPLPSSGVISSNLIEAGPDVGKAERLHQKQTEYSHDLPHTGFNRLGESIEHEVNAKEIPWKNSWWKIQTGYLRKDLSGANHLKLDGGDTARLEATTVERVDQGVRAKRESSKSKRVEAAPSYRDYDDDYSEPPMRTLYRALNEHETNLLYFGLLVLLCILILYCCCIFCIMYLYFRREYCFDLDCYRRPSFECKTGTKKAQSSVCSKDCDDYRRPSYDCKPGTKRARSSRCSNDCDDTDTCPS